MWVNNAERERSPVEIEKRGSGRETCIGETVEKSCL